MFGRKKNPDVKPPKKKKARVKPLLLEFRCRGNLIFTEHSERMTFPFKIGHAADNSLVLPSQERSSADYEAVLEVVKGKIVLNAAKDRFFYVHGVKKNSYVLPQEDRIAIGDCELFVSPAEKLKTNAFDVHQIEILNGSRKGQLIRLDKERLTVGSGEKCDLIFQNDVVSSLHAEIRVAPTGEAWLKDHQSLNGTFVNGKRLGAQDRVLMDSDKISFACYDCRFLDRNVVHTRSHVLRNILVMLATLAVALVVFAIFYVRIPQASQIAVRVEMLMKQERFDEAEKLLKKMPESRNFVDNEVQYAKLKARLSVYQTTYTAWTSFQKCIANGNFANASRYTSQLDLAREDAWNWDVATVHQRMDLARKSLHCYAKYRELAQIPHSVKISDPAILPLTYEECVKDPLLKEAKDDPAWLKPIYKKIDSCMKTLQNKCLQLKRVNDALDSLADGKNDFRQVKDALAKEQKNAGCLRYYFWRVQTAIEKMEAAQKIVDANVDAITEYEFNKVVFNPNIPGIETCSVHPALIKRHEQLTKMHYDVLAAESSIRMAYQTGFREFLTDCQLAMFKAIEIQNNGFETAIAECFKMPLDKFLMQEKKDTRRYLTIHVIYNIIQQTLTLDKTGYDLTFVNQNNRGNVLPLFNAGKTLSNIYNIAVLPENSFLRKNQFGEDMKGAAEVLATLSSVAKKCNDLAEKHAGDRIYFIAKPLTFINNPSSITQKEIERYRTYWKQYRQTLQALVDQYDPLNPQRAKEIRKKVFEIAVPGDPIISGIWNDAE